MFTGLIVATIYRMVRYPTPFFLFGPCGAITSYLDLTPQQPVNLTVHHHHTTLVTSPPPGDEDNKDASVKDEEPPSTSDSGLSFDKHPDHGDKSPQLKVEVRKLIDFYEHT